MSAIIEFPGKIIVTQDEKGEWQCADPIFLEVVKAFANRVLPQRYLPDPFEEQRDFVIKELHGRLIELILPPPPPEFRYPDGRHRIH